MKYIISEKELQSKLDSAYEEGRRKYALGVEERSIRNHSAIQIAVCDLLNGWGA